MRRTNGASSMSWLLTLSDLVRRRVQHVDVGIKAGLSAAQLTVIRDASTALTDQVDPSSLLSEAQRVCLVYADWMTKNVQVPQRVFDDVRAVLNDQRITEATTTVAHYNMISRFLVALDVGDMAAVPVPDVPLSE